MRKILKGIITSVFALSLILPTTVTIVNAKEITIDELWNTTTPAPNPVSAQALFDKIKSLSTTDKGLGSIAMGETLVIRLGNTRVQGNIDVGKAFSGTYSPNNGKHLTLAGGIFTTSGTGAIDYPSTPVNNLVQINEGIKSNITFEDSQLIPDNGRNAIYINNSSTGKFTINKGIIDCSNFDGIFIQTCPDLTVTNTTINGRVSNFPIEVNTTANIDKLTFTGNMIDGTFQKSPIFQGTISNALIDNNRFYGQYSDSTIKAGLYSRADSDSFNVTNNYFKNCLYALAISKRYTSNDNLKFTGSSFDYGLNDVIGIYEMDTSSATHDPVVDQVTHKYVTAKQSVGNTYAQDYWFSKTTSTSNDSTSAPPAYFPGYYYPPTTITPATKVDDPFVYVYKDTPIGITTTTTTPTTTDTTSRRDRSDRTTRSSRNANAVINASNKTLVAGSSFNFKEGVTATDNGGNGASLTNKVTITGSINTLKPGTYPITYKVTGANGVAVTKVVTVTVKAK